jgi:hypothetical protein
MKTLTNFNFQLQIDDEPSSKKLIDYCYKLRLKTKHITNYIELNCLKDLKFQSEDFGAIVIDLMHGYNDNEWSNYDNPEISFNKSVAVFKRFDKKRYDSLKTDDEFRALIYEYMVDAFKNIETKYKFPTKEILASYDELKNKNFINERIILKKSDKAKKIDAELHAAVTIDNFILTLKVYHDKKEIYNKKVFKTDPDELSYINKVKKLSIFDNSINILGTGDKVTFSLPLKEIGM